MFGKGDNKEKSLRTRDTFDRFFTDPFFKPFDSLVNEFRELRSVSGAMDVCEDDKGIEVKVDVPGYKSEDIDVEIDENVLTISAEAKEEKDEKEKKYHRRERYYRSFERSVALPAYADLDQVECEFKDGTLSVFIPKKEESKEKKRRIAVKSK